MPSIQGVEPNEAYENFPRKEQEGLWPFFTGVEMSLWKSYHIIEIESWKAAGMEGRSRAGLCAPQHPDLGFELLCLVS